VDLGLGGIDVLGAWLGVCSLRPGPTSDTAGVDGSESLGLGGIGGDGKGTCSQRSGAGLGV